MPSNDLGGSADSATDKFWPGEEQLQRLLSSLGITKQYLSIWVHSKAFPDRKAVGTYTKAFDVPAALRTTGAKITIEVILVHLLAAAAYWKDIVRLNLSIRSASEHLASVFLLWTEACFLAARMSGRRIRASWKLWQPVCSVSRKLRCLMMEHSSGVKS